MVSCLFLIYLNFPHYIVSRCRPGCGLTLLPIAELVPIANLSMPVSSSFDYLCSFYSCTPTPRCPSMAHTRFLTCRVGACAIDGRRGADVHLENVHKLRAGNRQLTNLRNPDEMFRYRKKRKPAPRTAQSTLCIWEVLVI